MSTVFFFLGFYLLGSIPSGVLFSRLKGKNIRKLGSGNTGAANVARNLGFLWGFLTFVCDFLKSYLPLSIYTAYMPFDRNVYFFAIFAVIGHCFSVFLRFRGGKGVSVSIGILAFFSWYYALIYIALFILIAIIFKISSIASLGSFFSVLGLIYFLPVSTYDISLNIFLFFVIIFIILLIMHRENIKRIIRRNEMHF